MSRKIQISEYGIHLGDSLLVPPDRKVYGLNRHHSVEFISQHVGLSSIEEVNQQIILKLDYNSILSLCSTNKEYSKLCGQDYFWKRMVERDFRGVFEYKPENISYREMYRNLYQIKDIKNILKKDDLYLIAWYHLNIHKVDANQIAMKGNLKVLKWLKEQRVLPDQWGADYAIQKRRSEVIKWMIEQGVLPSEASVNWIAEGGDLNLLIWLKEHGILPNQHGANLVAVQGHLEILIWLKEQGILPNQWGANEAAGRYNNFGILKWLGEQGILPEQKGANWAARIGDIEVLKWLKEQGILPDQRGAAVDNGDLTLLNWLRDQGIPFH
jgi:hypothetical protein